MADAANQVKESTRNSEHKSITIHVDGMHCAGCATSVEKALNAKEGVHSVNVSLATESAGIGYNPDKVGYPDFAEAVKQVGYEIREESGTTEVQHAPDHDRQDAGNAAHSHCQCH